MTPNGSILLLKPYGKMTALCMKVGEGDEEMFEINTFYSPLGDTTDQKSARYQLKQNFGLCNYDEEQKDDKINRVIKNFGGRWVQMRYFVRSRLDKEDPDFYENAVQQVIDCDEANYPTKQEVRNEYKRLEEDAELLAKIPVNSPDHRENTFTNDIRQLRDEIDSNQPLNELLTESISNLNRMETNSSGIESASADLTRLINRDRSEVDDLESVMDQVDSVQKGIDSNLRSGENE